MRQENFTMKKEDILALKTRIEILKALDTNRDLWDKEVDEHLKEVAKKEHIEKYGSLEVHVDCFPIERSRQSRF